MGVVTSDEVPTVINPGSYWLKAVSKSEAGITTLAVPSLSLAGVAFKFLEFEQKSNTQKSVFSIFICPAAIVLN